MTLQGIQRLAAIRSRGHRIAPFLQQIGNQPAHAGVVVDQDGWMLGVGGVAQGEGEEVVAAGGLDGGNLRGGVGGRRWVQAWREGRE